MNSTRKPGPARWGHCALPSLGCGSVLCRFWPTACSCFYCRGSSHCIRHGLHTKTRNRRETYPPIQSSALNQGKGETFPFRCQRPRIVLASAKAPRMERPVLLPPHTTRPGTNRFPQEAGALRLLAIVAADDPCRPCHDSGCNPPPSYRKPRLYSYKTAARRIGHRPDYRRNLFSPRSKRPIRFTHTNLRQILHLETSPPLRQTLSTPHCIRLERHAQNLPTSRPPRPRRTLTLAGRSIRFFAV